jgi:hypothetical protein
MWYLEDKFRVIIGGNTYINTPNLVVYKGKPLFTVRRGERDGLLGIDFDIFDKKGDKVATVRNGFVVHGNREDYEISEVMDRYTVTEKANGRLICDIRKRSKSPNAELEISVKLFTEDGFLFDANPQETNLPGVKLRGNVFENCGAGIVIG